MIHINEISDDQGSFGGLLSTDVLRVFIYDRISVEGGFDERYIKPTGRLYTVYCPDTSDIRILLSFINLVKEPIGWDQVDFSVTEDDAINWCTRYGFPERNVTVKNGQELERLNTEMLSLLKGKEWKESQSYSPEEALIVTAYPVKSPADWLRLETFQRWAIGLYLALKLWIIINTEYDNFEQEERANKEITEYIKLFYPIFFVGENLPRSFKSLSLMGKKIAAKDSILKLVNGRLCKMFPRLVISEGFPKVILTATSLLDVLYLQLAELVIRGKSSPHIKTCKACGNLFGGHGHSKYCNDPCNRKREWARERARERENTKKKSGKKVKVKRQRAKST